LECPGGRWRLFRLLGIGIGWSALNHANSVEQTTQTSVRQANDALAQKLAKEDEINQQLQSDLKVVTDKLNVTQSDLVKARKQNRQSSVTIDKRSRPGKLRKYAARRQG